MTRRVYRGPWPRVRRSVLERDGYVCQIKGPKCTTVATHVDHIIPELAGGSWYDEANLRAACRTCNLARSSGAHSHLWRTAATDITLVVGSDPSALTRYVKQEAGQGDLIVDGPSLTMALGSDEAARKARNDLIEKLRRGKVKAGRAWLTSQSEDAEAYLPHHRLIKLDPPTDQAAGSAPALPPGTRHDGQAARHNTSREW